MSVTFSCPSCGQRIEAEESNVGQIAPCPSCKQEILIPIAEKRIVTVAASPPAMSKASQRLPDKVEVVVTRINLPFSNVLGLVWQWFAASLVLGIVVGLIVLVIMALFKGL